MLIMKYREITPPEFLENNWCVFFCCLAQISSKLDNDSELKSVLGYVYLPRKTCNQINNNYAYMVLNAISNALTLGLNNLLLNKYSYSTQLAEGNIFL